MSTNQATYQKLEQEIELLRKKCEKTIAVGCNDYIFKPNTINVLKQMIIKNLKK